MVKVPFGRTIPESNTQSAPSSKQPLWVMVCSVGLGLSHRIAIRLETVTDFGTKYGDPFSMGSCVKSTVASVGQAPNKAPVIIARMTNLRVIASFRAPLPSISHDADQGSR